MTGAFAFKERKLIQTFLNGLSMPGAELNSSAVAIIAVVVVAVIMVIACFSLPTAQPATADRLDDITATFISAIPTLSKALNLEVATSKQTEVLELENQNSLFGVNLGTNRVQIQVPVTYRYTIALRDEWQLTVRGDAVLVRSPAIQCSLPPAIHTDQMKTRSERGWARLSPTDLMEQLHAAITPTLSRYAADPRRIALVRETCRESVAEFVQRWLKGWGGAPITSVYVQFADERDLPPRPTLQLSE